MSPFYRRLQEMRIGARRGGQPTSWLCGAVPHRKLTGLIGDGSVLEERSGLSAAENHKLPRNKDLEPLQPTPDEISEIVHFAWHARSRRR